MFTIVKNVEEFKVDVLVTNALVRLPVPAMNKSFIEEDPFDFFR